MRTRNLREHNRNRGRVLRVFATATVGALAFAGVGAVSVESAYGTEGVSQTDVELVEANVDASYTESGPVSRAEGDAQQIEAVTAQDQENADPDYDAHIARVDLVSNNVGVAATWDISALEPETVHLRYLQGETWSEWNELEFEEIPAVEGAKATRAGTELFLLSNAESVEVVARTAEGISLEGLHVTVVDDEGRDDAENSLEGVEAEESIEESVSKDEDALEEEQAPVTELEDAEQTELFGEEFVQEPEEESGGPSGEDVLLDLEGAFEGEASTTRQSATFENALGGAPASFEGAKLNSAGTVYDTGFEGLKITTRKGWGATESWMTWKPKTIKIKGAVVHHTQGNNNYTKDQAPGQVRIVYQYHARTLGWGDIGYNLIVDKYGGVYEGRSGGLTNGIQGAQALGANAETFGISILGDFRFSPPPAVARQAMSKAIAWKLGVHDFESSTGNIQVPGYYNVVQGKSGTITVPLVSGHRDIGATDCPGNAFYAQMGTVRSEVSAHLKKFNAAKKPATVKGFDPQNVISDKTFYDKDGMTEAQVKALIESAGAKCKSSGDRACLKDTRFPTQRLTTVRGGCKPFTLTGEQRPWTIIHHTAQACGINPKVLLVTLQKEQSALTQPVSVDGFAKAMGSGCPDGQDCAPEQAGFAKQVYYGADKLVSYKLQSQAGHVDAFKAGKAVTVQHNPKAACGSQSLKFANVATASLYEYTPYIGNSGKDGCSVIGQRMFYDLMERYFPGTSPEKPAPVKPAPVKPSPVVSKVKPTSIAGADRYATNYELNRQNMKAGNPVFVVTGRDFPDALSIGPVAGMLGGSVVLTRPAALSAASLNLISQKKPSAVYIVGGTGAVSSNVAQQLQGATGKTPTRIGGGDRYETSEKVFTTFFKNRSIGAPFVASGSDYPDALSASAAGGALGRPVLLVPGNASDGKLTNNTVSTLKSKGVKQVVLVGGKGAISSTVESNIGKQGFSANRQAGANRYLTSQAVNKYLDSQASKTAVTGLWLASGRTFPDALSAAAAAGSSSQRLVLTNGQCVAKPMISEKVNGSGAKVTKITTVGGKGVLPGFTSQVQECK